MVPIKFSDLERTNETALLREGPRDTEGCLEVGEFWKTLLSASSSRIIYSSPA